MVQINTEEFYKLVIDEEGEFIATRPCVVVFYLEYCTACKEAFKNIEYLRDDYPDIDFYMINASTQKEVTKLMGIKAAPTVCCLKSVDFTPIKGYRTVEEYKDKIDRLLH